MSAAQVSFPSAAYPPFFPSNVLPMLWAVGDEVRIPEYIAEAIPELSPEPLEPAVREVPAGIVFYRKYTEAILRRYVRLELEAGKVPSLLGQEMFRGKVTSYRVGNFDDAVIFVADIEHCLRRLDLHHQHLITRIALQEYTIGEAAELLGIPHRSVIRHYGIALDRLTRIFLEIGMLEPLKCCQGGSM